jgi:hypothetical protein
LIQDRIKIIPDDVTSCHEGDTSLRRLSPKI